MKVYIEYDLANTSGKGKFLSRLTREWDKIGIKYSDNQKGCDVRLAITRYRTKSKLPTAIRIDGAHAMMPINEINGSKRKKVAESTKWKNKHTTECINKAKVVIWQSEFCKKAGHSFWKIKPKKEYVIFNGASKDEFLPRAPEKRIVMSAYWKKRPHKRLNEMLEIALDYVESHTDVYFDVLGDIEIAVPSHKNIVYHGYTNHKGMAQVFAKAAGMLNLCYSDWCPNAVVEALVAGVPVICTANHGASEIVGDSGIVLDVGDDVINNRMPTQAQIPIKNKEPIYNALDTVLKGKSTFSEPEHLDISKIALKYAGVLSAIKERRKK